jgi:cation-transporting ATPase 13A1
VPEINEQLKLVPFTLEFKVLLCSAMIGDYVGCLVIEKALKWCFSDYRPKDIAIRRPDQLKREKERRDEELAEEERKKEEAAGKV